MPLGTGDTDFSVYFSELQALPYSGSLIMQVARGDDGDESDWARANLEFIGNRLDQKQ